MGESGKVLGKDHIWSFDFRQVVDNDHGFQYFVMLSAQAIPSVGGAICSRGHRKIPYSVCLAHDCVGGKAERGYILMRGMGRGDSFQDCCAAAEKQAKSPKTGHWGHIDL
ncbi:MAG: hypothetical protein V1897_20230 [Pseudomonadota bacterium]